MLESSKGVNALTRRRSWDAAADIELRRRAAANEPVGAIAKAMDRTVDSVRGRANRLRIIVKSSLRPWRPVHPRHRPASPGE